MTCALLYSDDFSSSSKKDIDPLALLHDHALESDPELDISVLTDDELLDLLKANKDGRPLQGWLGTTLTPRLLGDVLEPSSSCSSSSGAGHGPTLRLPDSPVSASSSSSLSAGSILSLDNVPFSHPLHNSRAFPGHTVYGGGSSVGHPSYASQYGGSSSMSSYNASQGTAGTSQTSLGSQSFSSSYNSQHDEGC
ncbi:hypothetical protein K437DRAFT_254291 [Tilletiaria anomala UBC 951]|uniref:Uncharacterized protein n=1 Tax=Tilletiaria anomala (strain ATCC 24038 / CBS 436.72 / UBC 951) TaxID=1037660 RepID=A0A066WEX7_TILAU|nr:uncharacterized protein K437DRAFT_254291 [Tilletiaria anomala UBC 951]KDN52306.1 hypothetical protein K437DRAFT_254291 [Tilletiaria anomala UBC 951]